MTTLDTLPVVGVTLGGVALDEGAGGFIAELEVTLRTYEPGACEIVLRDPDGTFGERAALGARLEIRIGTDQQLLFCGNVAGIEYSAGPSRDRQLRLLAYDALDSLRREMAVRVHVDTTFSDLAREFARTAGLEVACDVTTPLHRRIVQHRRSDLDMLAEVAERSGLGFHAHDATLYAYPLSGTGDEIVLEYGSSLREAKVVWSDVDDAGAVDVRGWDAQRIEARRGNARGTGKAPPLPLTNVVLESDAQADALARAQLDRRSLSRFRFEAVAEGDPRLRPGAKIKLRGISGSVEGPHAVTEATHRFSPAYGYTTSLRNTLPAPHPSEEHVSGTLGVVVDVRDPQSFGRIKVKYPALADAESDWLQVLAAGAGGGKGLVALPAVNDSVLVLVFDGDASHGIVLGALYGTSGMPARRERSFSGYAFFSPSGHVVELNDDNALSLHGKDGSYLELAKDGTTLHSEFDLTIDAPGKTITIRADRVDMEQK